MTPCELCRGACCETIVLLRGSDSDDVWQWLSFHGKEEDGTVRLPIPCQHLKEGRCSIYETRPNCCREYKVGSDACLKALARRENAQDILKLINDSKTENRNAGN